MRALLIAAVVGFAGFGTVATASAQDYLSAADIAATAASTASAPAAASRHSARRSHRRSADAISPAMVAAGVVVAASVASASGYYGPYGVVPASVAPIYLGAVSSYLP